MAWRRRGWPWLTAYWFAPASIAALAASRTQAGGSKSGKPCDRFTAWCSRARRLISLKMDVPKPVTRAAMRAGVVGVSVIGGTSGVLVASLYQKTRNEVRGTKRLQAVDFIYPLIP